MIVDAVFFQTTGDAVPRKESGCLGKPRGPVDPKSEVVIKRKTNPEMRKRMTNFVLEMSIRYELYRFFLFLKLHCLDVPPSLKGIRSVGFSIKQNPPFRAWGYFSKFPDMGRFGIVLV